MRLCSQLSGEDTPGWRSADEFAKRIRREGGFYPTRSGDKLQAGLGGVWSQRMMHGLQECEQSSRLAPITPPVR
jgi:hypothetical protein